MQAQEKISGATADFSLSFDLMSPAFSGLSIDSPEAGSNFTLVFSLPVEGGERRVRTVPFTILPDHLDLAPGQVR